MRNRIPPYTSTDRNPPLHQHPHGTGHRLYTALGYRETARRPNPHRPGWTVVDMAKPLPSVAAPGEG
jgi:hypothetical protein